MTSATFNDKNLDTFHTKLFLVEAQQFVKCIKFFYYRVQLKLYTLKNTCYKEYCYLRHGESDYVLVCGKFQTERKFYFVALLVNEYQQCMVMKIAVHVSSK